MIVGVAALLVLTASGQIPKTPKPGESLPGIDLPGANIDHITLEDPISKDAFDGREISCFSACEANPKCVAWTYVAPNTIQGPHGQCWLKSAFVKQVPNACCTSGTLATNDIDRPGSDYRHFTKLDGKAVDVRQCRQACMSDAPCAAWTLDRNNGTCWLKKSVPAPVKNKCCVSGSFVFQPR